MSIKYSLLNRQKDINAIALAESDKVFAFHQDGLTSYSPDLKTINWRVKLAAQYLSFADNKFIYPYSLHKRIYKLDKNNGNILLDSEMDFVPEMQSENIIIGEYSEQEKEYASILSTDDFSLKKIQELGDFMLKYLDNNRVISIDAASVHCFSRTNDLKKWVVDIGVTGQWKNIYGEDEPGRIRSIQVIKNLVIVVSGDKIIAFSIETGEISWNVKLKAAQAWIVEYQGLLYVKSGFFYYIINSIDGKIILEADTFHMWKDYNFAIWPAEHIITTDYIFITDTISPKIGIIDKHTFEILEIIELNIKNEIPVYNSPIVISNKIYQLDGDRVLHVFVKD